jgi:putative inorganic carbon (HCO3(-)) transporter
VKDEVMASAAEGIEKLEKSNARAGLAYGALIVFSFLYYARPEDVIPGLSYIPWGKISGGIALLALIARLAGGKLKTKFPLELKVLLLLYAHLIVCIPFAVWRGGAFAQVFEKFSKEVITAALVSLIVLDLLQLRRLLLIQAASVAAMTVVSVIIHPGGARLQGALGGIFENPNDLAVNIAINFPLCLTFLFASRGIVKKGFWAIGLLAMPYAVVATYSRSGLMAMIVSVLICLWEFGIRGKRFYVLLLSGILGILGLGVAISTPHYATRIQSLFSGNIEGSADKGSLEARKELLRQSIQLTLQHPVFGVGAGNFPVATEAWRVAHNTYTELSAEGGFPALILFLTFLVLAFRNVRRVRKTSRYREDEQIQLFASAMWASLAAYVVGAMFSSTEYQLFPYFMVAYTSVLYRITTASEPAIDDRQRFEPGWQQRAYAAQKPELVWNR